jgi:hypothetical protein
VSDDIPNEESLHIVLLSADGLVVTRKDLGWAYQLAIVREILAEGDELRFSFPDGIRWRVSARTGSLFQRKLLMERIPKSRPER